MGLRPRLAEGGREPSFSPLRSFRKSAQQLGLPSELPIRHTHAFGSRKVAAWWAGGFDLLVTPTIPEPPPPLGELVPDSREPLKGFQKSGGLVAFTVPFNVTGQPAISLPLHWTPGGLPVGVQLVAAIGHEDLLIRVASQLEQAQPWIDRRPPLHA